MGLLPIDAQLPPDYLRRVGAQPEGRAFGPVEVNPNVPSREHALAQRAAFDEAAAQRAPRSRFR